MPKQINLSKAAYTALGLNPDAQYTDDFISGEIIRLAGGGNTKPNPERVSMLDMFQGLPASEQLAFKNDHPEMYKSLLELAAGTGKTDYSNNDYSRLLELSAKGSKTKQETENMLDLFQGLPISRQLAFKNEHPNLYKELFNRL